MGVHSRWEGGVAICEPSDAVRWWSGHCAARSPENKWKILYVQSTSVCRNAPGLAREAAGAWTTFGGLTSLIKAASAVAWWKRLSNLALVKLAMRSMPPRIKLVL